MNTFSIFVLCSLLLFSLTVSAASNHSCSDVPGFTKDHLDFGVWDALMKQYVTEAKINDIDLHAVNYTGIAADDDFFLFGCQLENSNVTGFSYEQWYAFYINAYNYMAIKTIITHACLPDLFGNCTKISSILQVGYQYPSIVIGDASVWDMKNFVIAKETVSLRDVEDNRLRNPKKGGFDTENAQLHACIVCASVSCPDLRAEAYTVEKLNDQMADSVRKFLANPKKGLSLKDGKLTISPIFEWFFNDFNNGKNDWKSNSKSLSDFLLQFTNNTQVKKYITDNAKTINDKTTPIFQYNWNLNGEVGSLCTEERFCYSLLSLAITLAILGVLILIIIILCLCCRPNKRDGYVKA